LLSPGRSKTNYRNYSLEQVRHLLNIALLINNGFRISKLSLLSHEEINGAIKGICNEEVAVTKAINDLIYFMFSENTDEFEYILDCCVHLLGIDTTIQKIILPFLEKVNLLSYNSSESEVHFVVTAIRRKIILGIETVKTSHNSSKSVLLFLPEKEHYDLILLSIAYKLKSLGIRVLYLGTNISIVSLAKVVTEKQPDLLLTHIPTKTIVDTDFYFSTLKKRIKDTELLIAKSDTQPDTLNHSTFNFFHYKEVESLFSPSGFSA